MRSENRDVIIWAALVIFAILSGIIVFNAGSSKFFIKITLLIIYVTILIGILVKDIKSVLLFLIILVGPFDIHRYFVYDYSLNLWAAVNLVDFLLFILYAFWLAETVAKRGLKIRLLKDCLLPLAGLLVMFVLSGFNAVDRIGYIYNTATLFRGILIFYYVANSVNTKKALTITIIALLAGVVFQSAVAIMQETKGGVVGLRYIIEPQDSRFQNLGAAGSVYRVTGTFPSHNLFCFMYLDYLLPVLAALVLLRSPALTKFAASLIFVAALFAFIFTLSRGGWLSFAVACAAFFFLYYFKARTGQKRPFLLFLLVLCLLGLPLIFMKDVLFSRILVDDLGAAVMRLPLMQVAFKIISLHPVLGIGAGNYLSVMHLYDVTREGITSTFVYPVHNLYLLIAAETGVASLFFFLLFLFAVSKRALRTVRSQDPCIALVSIGMLSGVAGAMFHGMFESMFMGRIILLWLITGVIVSLSDMAGDAKGF